MTLSTMFDVKASYGEHSVLQHDHMFAVPSELLKKLFPKGIESMPDEEVLRIVSSCKDYINLIEEKEADMVANNEFESIAKQTGRLPTIELTHFRLLRDKSFWNR